MLHCRKIATRQTMDALIFMNSGHAAAPTLPLTRFSSQHFHVRRPTLTESAIWVARPFDFRFAHDTFLNQLSVLIRRKIDEVEGDFGTRRCRSTPRRDTGPGSPFILSG